MPLPAHAQSSPLPVRRDGLDPFTGRAVPDNWVGILLLVLGLDSVEGYQRKAGGGYLSVRPSHLATLTALLEHALSNEQIAAALEASRRLNASIWFSRSPFDISDHDLVLLNRERPWDLSTANQQAWRSCMAMAFNVRDVRDVRTPLAG